MRKSIQFVQCDRCGKKLEAHNSSTNKQLELINEKFIPVTVNCIHYDICKPCAREVFTFVQKEVLL